MNIFDIIGPTMIGPSSSHTAGACRIGYIAYRLLPGKAVKADITLVGSFASTYKGHGTDKAIVAGILGLKPSDNHLKDSFALAKKQGLSFTIKTTENNKLHPNTALITLTDDNNNKIEIEGSSIGGGNIIISKINGMPSGFTGEYNTLVIPHKDTPGVIAEVTNILNKHNINISGFKLSRVSKGKQAIMTIEIDNDIDKNTLNLLRKLSNITSVVYLHANKEEKYA